jgi:hypothetical protein
MTYSGSQGFPSKESFLPYVARVPVYIQKSLFEKVNEMKGCTDLSKIYVSNKYPSTCTNALIFYF